MNVKRDWTDLKKHGEEIDYACAVLVRALKKEKAKPTPDTDKLIKLNNAIVFSKRELMPFIKQYLGLKELYEQRAKQ